MPTSMEKAWEAAEEQRAARQRVTQRTVVDAASKQGRRIELLEVYSTWDQEKISRLENFIGAYLRDHDFEGRRDGGKSAEDFVQEAIYATLRWPAAVVKPHLLENLVLWIAKRNVHADIIRSRERNEDRLERPVGEEDDAQTKGELIADSYCDEDGMDAPIELWYVQQFIRGLLEEGRDNDQICTFLGVRRAVVEHMRAALREEHQLAPHKFLFEKWPAERCVKTLRAYAAQHEGVGPTIKAQRASDDLPPVVTLVRLYGSRRKGLEAAGVRAPEMGWHGPRLDKVEVSKTLVAWVRKNGHWPSVEETRSSSGLPSEGGFKSLYGSCSRGALYGGVLRTLGKEALEGIDPPPTRNGFIVPQRAAEDVLRWKEEHGRWPGKRDWGSRNGLISTDSATRIFGSSGSKGVAAAVTAMLDRDDEKEKVAC